MNNNWVKTNDFYNKDVVTCDVWSKKLGNRGTVYIQDNKNFTYTFSCGANSDYSFTGCFFETTVKSVDEAKKWIDMFIPLHFLSTTENLKELKKIEKIIKINE